jgi:hypothetical protein
MFAQNFNGGAQCNKDFITGEFFEQTTGWMNKNPRVARYSVRFPFPSIPLPFLVRPDRLLSFLRLIDCSM